MGKIIKILGLIKLCFYKLLGWKIYFDKTIYFRPTSKIVFKDKGAQLHFGKNVSIDGNCRILLNKNGNACIEDNVVIRENVYLEVGRDASLLIKKSAFLNRGVTIVCMNQIILGEHIAVGNNASFFDHDHIMKKDCRQNWNESKRGRIEIGRDTWIAANTLILRDYVIGNACIVGGGVVFKGELENNRVISYSAECYQEKEL